jgi:signal transduction histidine kinase
MDTNPPRRLPVSTAAPSAPLRVIRRRARPLIRSAGIRFALLYAVVFGASAFALAFSLWYSTVGLLERQVSIAIRNDATALDEHYELGGLPALIGALRDRLADNADNDDIYLLQDSLGNRIIGNLSRWPPQVTDTDTLQEVPIVIGKNTVQVAVRAFLLDGGEQLLVGRDVRARAELRDVLRDGLLWAMALMFALGVVGAILIRSLFRRMIRDISATTRAIARGDLTRRIAKTGDGDEFDELAGIINDMLERIARLMDGVRHVSNSIAHDLRTPITRARTRLEDASLHAQSEDDLRSAIERATQDLDGIVGVFEALLRIAEIEAGSRRAAFARIDLAPLIHDIDELYRAVAEERGLVLETLIPDSLPLLGDRELIQQAIANLLDNALKFSPPNAVISLAARIDESAVEISVADRGPGIAEVDRERATERFFRAESARTTSGSGLGLALVAAVAQLHYGTLRLTDNHPGLRAIISLPTGHQSASGARQKES